MIGHQYVSINPTPRFVCVFAQPVQIKAVVRVGVKARLSIVSTLDDV
jgi:hypothetical protein